MTTVPTAYLTLGLLVYALAATAWILLRSLKSGNAGNMLYIKAGRGLIPIPLKPGQKRYVWTRPDKTKVAFPLSDEWGIPLGKRGMLWIGDSKDGKFLRWSTERQEWVALNAAAKPDEPVAEVLSRITTWLKPGAVPAETNIPEGALLKVEFETKPLSPSGTDFAMMYDDDREVKWFQGHKAADAPLAKKFPPWALIALGVVVWWFMQGGGFPG